ncbi:MAG TPA: hypothetical protein VH482_02995 [Thermomicrobiales bacterium]
MDSFAKANVVAQAIHRERRMADAARTWKSERSDRVEGEETESVAGAWKRYRHALARAARSFRLGAAPRPEPVAR